jgi:hypothetical protein
MVTIHSVKLDTIGWSEQENSLTQKVWSNEAFPEILSLHYFPLPPDIPFNLTEINALREDSARNIKSQGGVVVEVAVETIQGIDVLRKILKFPMYNDGRPGRIYLGSYTLPFALFSYVIKVQSQEVGITGVREANVMGWLMNEHDPEVEEIMQNPAQGPEVDDGWGGKAIFDPRILKIAARADDEKYDADFPNHPLTRVRAHLRHVKATLVMDDAVKKSKRFRKRI